MREILLSLCLSFITSSIIAQIPDTMELYTDNFTVASFQTVDIPIKVINYEKIEAAQFSLNWNPHHLQFDKIVSTNPDSQIESTDLGLGRAEKGIIVFSFIDPQTGGVSLPDSSTLFTLRFKAIGAPSEKILFNISGYDRKIDFYGQGVFRTVIARKSRNTITAPTSLRMYTTACSVSKPAIPNGKITIKPYGGQSPLRLYFRDLSQQTAEISILGNGSSMTFDSLASGAYEIKLIDGNGHEMIDTIDLDLVQAWNLDLKLTPPSCGNRKDGSAFVNYLDGYAAPYVITWSNFNLLNPRLGNIGNGSYYIQIEDRLGCIHEEQFSFKVPEPTIDIETFPASCASVDDGTVDVKVLKDGQVVNSVFRYILDNRDAVDTTFFSAENLSFGPHHITVIDKNQCDFTSTFTIGVEHSMEILDSTTLNIGCDRSPGGFLIEVRDTGLARSTITPTLVPDVGYITQTDSLIVIQDLPEGNYTLFLSIDNAPSMCGDSVNFSITTPSLINIQAQTIQDESCYGLNDGVIDIIPSGGLGSFYSYQWQDGNDSSYRENLGPGEYCITVTDDSGCLSDTCFSILAGTDYEFVLDTVKSLTCHNTADGFFSFHLNHLSGPESDSFTINITPKVHPVVNQEGVYIIDSLEAGAYGIEIINEYGCVIDTFVNVGKPAFPTITLDSIGYAGCFNSPQGYISLSATLEDTATYVKWDWSSGDTTAYIGNLTAGTYMVTVTNENNCEHELQYFIDSLGGPEIEHIIVREPLCFNDSNGQIELVARSYKAGIESIVWNGRDTTAVIDSLSSGTYFYEVIDSAGCVLRDSVNLSQPDSLFATIETEPQRGGELGSATAFIQGGTKPYDITWSVVPPIKGDTTIRTPAGNYSLVVLDKNLCLSITGFFINDLTSVSQIEESKVMLYPNPVYDILYLKLDPSLTVEGDCTDCDQLSLVIYNNYGQQVSFMSEKNRGLYTINMDSFTPGIYFIILKQNNKLIYNNKITVQR